MMVRRETWDHIIFFFARKKKRSPYSLSIPNNNEHNMVVLFYNKWKKYNEIQLTKKNGLNNWKKKNHQPSHIV